MSKPTALITGGCGFVGRHLVKKLLARDYQITVVDNLSTGLEPGSWPPHLRLTEPELSAVTFHHTDVRLYSLCGATIRPYLSSCCGRWRSINHRRRSAVRCFRPRHPCLISLTG